MIKSKLAFFQKQEEVFSWNTVIFSKHAFSLVQKVLDAIDMIFFVGKERWPRAVGKIFGFLK